MRVSLGLAIVTGTSTGIGEAVARLLLEHGWAVIGIARRRAVIDHDQYHHLSLDLRQFDTAEDALRDCVVPLLRQSPTRVGLVNNAASPDLLGVMERTSAAALLDLLAVNTVAPISLMALLSRECDPVTPLRIVNVSSGAAVNAFPGLAAYSSSKAALRMAGMVIAAEWASNAPHARTRPDAAILSYEPGIVDTEMQVAARSADTEAFPWVTMFRDFAERGMLVPPAAPARDIVEFLETDGHPPFTERRLGAGA
jgi:benzil reductase ((S)-benzoin forming)